MESLHEHGLGLWQARAEALGRRLRAAAALTVGAITLAACVGSGTGEAAPSPSRTGAATSSASQPAGPRTGYDVSFPQCGKQLPEPGSFAVVGVNGNYPTTPNPCFHEQARWARQSKGDTDRPKLAVYVNAANPADMIDRITTWPESGSSKKYGACDGSGSTACSYQYGRERIMDDLMTITPLSASRLEWWIAVEPNFAWEPGPDGQKRNRAALEGMVDTLRKQGVKEVGVYTSPAIWSKIVGVTQADSSLRGLNIWILGAHSVEQARANCANTPSFTGGRVVMAQMAGDNYPVDQDISCRYLPPAPPADNPVLSR